MADAKLIMCIFIVPIVTDCDTGPSPSTLIANAVTIMSVDGGHNDVEISNTWLHIPSSQEEAGMVDEPQMLPEQESE